VAPETQVIGPVLREELRQAEAREGDFLLAYFNKGRHQFTASLDLALRRLDARVVVYGTPYRGRVDNLEFRAPGNLEFIRDLAACRAVIGTAGNQLIGEAIHFRKPILALPESVFEQQLNAWTVQRMGIGARARLTTLTVGDIEDFLVGVDACRARMPVYPGDGRELAVSALLQFCRELGGRTASAASRNRNKASSQLVHS
jgi:uncharacterized protein (TIGR00661 family)